MTAAPLAAGVLLSVLGGVIRIRAWHASLSESAPSVRYRDVVVAHLGGAGVNSLVPMHGGDAVKLALLKRRSPDSRLGQLLGSLAPPAALEALLTALLLAWAVGTGVVEVPSPEAIPLPIVGAAAALAAGLLWVLARTTPKLLRDVRAGMGALRHPRQLLRAVAPWVLLGRVFRLAAIACYLTAVGLPATFAGLLVVMSIMGGVGVSAPASAPVRIAVLAASLPAALGVHAVSFATATTLLGAMTIGPMVASLTISVVVLGITLRTTSPRKVVAYCRQSVAVHRAPVAVESEPDSAAVVNS